MYKVPFFTRYGFKILLGVVGIALIAGGADLIRAVDAAQSGSTPWVPVYAMFGIWPWVFVGANGLALLLYAFVRRPVGD